jgi:hypothetical protein
MVTALRGHLGGAGVDRGAGAGAGAVLEPATLTPATPLKCSDPQFQFPPGVRHFFAREV